MPKLIILGTANAIATPAHNNTHMVIAGESCLVLIDCVDNPVLRLQKAGLDALEVSDLILTHFHPDHVGGAPQFLMNSWLLGRSAPLTIHGLAHTLDRIEKVMEFYDWHTWPNFYPVHFNRLPETEMSPVLGNSEMRIFSSPVVHLTPTIGLRLEFLSSGKTMAYSCDTQPCRQVVRLASGVDILLHEATGALHGHSSAQQAGEIAKQAGAAKLLLIHYHVWEHDPQPLVAQAAQAFGGPVALSEDFMAIDF